VKLGFSLPTSGAWATPENQREVARRAESLGYASLWTFERLLYPLQPQELYFGGGNVEGRWPPTFERVLDPMVVLSYVAAVTERIRLGVAGLILPLHPPVLLAKQAATLDRLCRGRLDVGVVLGWSRDEYQSAGVPFRERARRMDEGIQALKALWTRDPVEFDGAGFSVPSTAFEPKPVQSPHPPLLIGGYAGATIERVVRWGDGYLAGNMPLDRVAPLLDELGLAAQRAGRDPETVRLVSRGTVVLAGEPQAGDRRPLFGSLDEIREDVDRYRKAGLSELFLDLNFDPAVGAVHADAEVAMAQALRVMEALAPDA
jgi:probable F420-dependent oxidoreductase